jgi:hypothetical protein
MFKRAIKKSHNVLEGGQEEVQDSLLPASKAIHKHRTKGVSVKELSNL